MKASCTVSKELRCEEAPKILCVHLNKTLSSDFYGGSFNPNMRFDEKLMIKNTSSNKLTTPSKNSSIITTPTISFKIPHP